MSVFLRTSGQRGENVATEILVYLLNQKLRFEKFKNSFFNNLIGNQTNEFGYTTEMYTQRQFGYDRPDIVALVNGILMVFEIKLGSFLSGQDQLSRYTNIFNATNRLRRIFPSLYKNEIKDKMLIYIAPKKIIQSSISITDSQVKGGSFGKYCFNSGITFKSISWEKINDFLDYDNELEKELGLYIDIYLSKNFTKEEIMALNQTDVPKALLRLYKKIDYLKLNINFKSLDKIGQSDSSRYHGFYFGNDTKEFYFGYILPNWEAFGTPIFINIRKNRIHQNVNKTINQLIEFGFQINKDDPEEYLIPFDINNVSEWQIMIENVIDVFK